MRMKQYRLQTSKPFIKHPIYLSFLFTNLANFRRPIRVPSSSSNFRPHVNTFQRINNLNSKVTLEKAHQLQPPLPKASRTILSKLLLVFVVKRYSSSSSYFFPQQTPGTLINFTSPRSFIPVLYFPIKTYLFSQCFPTKYPHHHALTPPRRLQFPEYPESATYT